MTDNLTSHNSSEYDKQILKTIPYYDYFHQETLFLVKSIFPNPAIWLDTGCGTGNLIEKARVEFPNCRFLLSDPSDEMLGLCRNKFSNSNIEIIGKHKTSEIRLVDKPEIITAIQSHHYLAKKERAQATAHCYSLLHKNGLYITFENIKLNSTAGTENGLKRWMAYQARQGKSNIEVEKHISRFGTSYFPISVSEHIDLLKSTGFQSVELFWLSNMQAGFYGIKK